MKPRLTAADFATSMPLLGLPKGPPGTTRETAISITDLNNSAKQLVEETFGHFWVRGEVSDFKRHRNGHWYFCLRDSRSQISCVIWSSNQDRIPTSPDDGMQVVALAQMTVFPGKGGLQLKVLRIEAEGDGLWRKAMAEIVERLRADGLLDKERKRPIPLYPRCLAVVTSANGAALRDIISVATRRRPGIEIVVSCAAVQGESAPRELRAALSRVRRWQGVDVMIIGRGGGARDDLRAFNDESVARAIAACEMPVISAVGHEIDVTVCDLVADARASTPSAAAERAVPALADLDAALRARRAKLLLAVNHRTASAQRDFRAVARDLKAATIRLVDQRRSLMRGVAGELNALSPLATLSRGYAVARGPRGETLSSAAQFTAGDSFDLTLRDGVVGALVENVRSPGVAPDESLKTDV
jgi:exodeoxyribonuclease VII large subunit